MPIPGPDPEIAVLLPCYNEEHAIGTVVADLHAVLPTARIYVYDNNSRDRTAAAAREAGAIVRTERQQGKGHVIRRMFADIEADVYVLMDGDDTYDAADASRMVGMLLNEQLDMITGTRVAPPGPAYRAGHRLGNRMLTGLVRAIFGDRISDMLSGYRVFSRRFVKSFPVLSTGFEIETEFTVHALELNMPIGETETAYRSRPAGSVSKLHTVTDGLRIVRTIIRLVKDERPLQLFCAAGVVLFACGIALGIPVVTEFWQTHLVPRLPTAVLAASLMLLAFLSFASGLILEFHHPRTEGDEAPSLSQRTRARSSPPWSSLAWPSSADVVAHDHRVHHDQRRQRGEHRDAGQRRRPRQGARRAPSRHCQDKGGGERDQVTALNPVDRG